MPVFGNNKKKDAAEQTEQTEQIKQEETMPKSESAPTPAPAEELPESVVRAVKSAIKTVDMFRDTAQDVLDANQDSSVSGAELKDLIARCKSYSAIVEKEFKIMRRRFTK